MAGEELNEGRMTVMRVFDAPREVVWKAWTEPQYVMRWWGPNGFSIPACTMDFRAGGKFLLCMKTEGYEGWTGGEYHAIVPHERIDFSMYFADKDGNKVEPEHYGVEHEAIEGADDVVLFEDAGSGGTKVTYIGNETMEDARASGQLEAMEQSLDKFATVLGTLQQKV